MRSPAGSTHGLSALPPPLALMRLINYLGSRLDRVTPWMGHFVGLQSIRREIAWLPAVINVLSANIKVYLPRAIFCFDVAA